MTEDINVFFIIKKDCRDENDCSEEMQLAYLTCEQHCGGGLQAKWVHETQCKQFEGLMKKDVFVLAEFKDTLSRAPLKELTHDRVTEEVEIQTCFMIENVPFSQNRMTVIMQETERDSDC